MPPRLLSKSSYVNGLQCLKYLWMIFHERDKIAEPDTATQYVFDQGHEVGELAKKLFPDGTDIPDSDFMGNIRQTRELLKQRRTVFEAGISTGKLYCRLDILRPAGDDEWDIVEVKSSTKVKDVDIEDVSFQKYCCQQAGLEIRNCYLMHIDNSYVRHGKIDPEKLFIIEDITEQVTKTIGSVPEKVAMMLAVTASKSCPEIGIGRQCSNPYECLVEGCRDFLPEDNVLELFHGGQKSFELLNSGVLAICDIPDDFILTASQQIQRACLESRLPHVDKKSLRSFLDKLEYPLYFFDFETFATAIPLVENSHPYQNIPFQFSLHVMRQGALIPDQFSFLADGAEDPRPRLLAELKKRLGANGSIIVYNQGFEKGVLEDLGEAFPKYNSWAKSVITRLVDLYQPFRSFWYYHPAQKGSASLKAVMPALTGRSYDELNISKGDDASYKYLRVTYGDVPEEERQQVRRDLETYCGRDTEGMIWIINTLRELEAKGK